MRQSGGGTVLSFGAGPDLRRCPQCQPIFQRNHGREAVDPESPLGRGRRRLSRAGQRQTGRDACGLDLRADCPVRPHCRARTHLCTGDRGRRRRLRWPRRFKVREIGVGPLLGALLVDAHADQVLLHIGRVDGRVDLIGHGLRSAMGRLASTDLEGWIFEGTATRRKNPATTDRAEPRGVKAE
jgi:hypothetical protein